MARTALLELELRVLRHGRLFKLQRLWVETQSQHFCLDVPRPHQVTREQKILHIDGALKPKNWPAQLDKGMHPLEPLRNNGFPVSPTERLQGPFGGLDFLHFGRTLLHLTAATKLLQLLDLQGGSDRKLETRDVDHIVRLTLEVLQLP